MMQIGTLMGAVLQKQKKLQAILIVELQDGNTCGNFSKVEFHFFLNSLKISGKKTSPKSSLPFESSRP